MGKFYILGGNSFVGKNFYEHIKYKQESILLFKNELSFLNPESFKSFDFEDSTIVDFINVNNGIDEDILQCNYYGFKNFCGYLMQNFKNVNYIYTSTISVLDDPLRFNSYVKSKKLAEDYLMTSNLYYQIVRLSYPIGLGENKSRLVSKLIEKMKRHEPLSINNILINLNNIEDVVSSYYFNLLKDKTAFISNNDYRYLKDIILFLSTSLNSKSEIVFNEVEKNFTPLSSTPFQPKFKIENTLLQML